MIKIMKYMRNLLYICIAILISIRTCYPCELILPKEKHSIVNTQYAFFVGKANNQESIYINDDKIHTAPNGAFAHSVKLKDGENRIVLKSGFKRQIFKIYKEQNIQQNKIELLEFSPKLYKVINDNTPLRSTPVDGGMNRISHLFEDTNVIINGQQGDFYRVFLSKNKSAWIAKKDVYLPTLEETTPNFITMNSQTFKNASIHTIEFTGKLPYTIDETDKEIIFKVYNPQVSEDSVYTVNIIKPEKYIYKVVLCNGVYQLKVNKLLPPDNDNLDGITIAVDAGHGGLEKGAIGCLGNCEKDINLKIAKELKDILSVMGANVVMTRECDASISLNERVKFAQANEASIFVSIHLNSIGDTKMNIHKNRGTSVFYYNKNSKDLANILQKSITEKISSHKDGVKAASFAVIRPTDYVGVLVEAAYMTNPLDSMLYTSDNFARDTAMGIAEGILSFVTSK